MVAENASSLTACSLLNSGETVKEKIVIHFSNSFVEEKTMAKFTGVYIKGIKSSALSNWFTDNWAPFKK